MHKKHKFLSTVVTKEEDMKKWFMAQGIKMAVKIKLASA